VGDIGVPDVGGLVGEVEVGRSTTGSATGIRVGGAPPPMLSEVGLTGIMVGMLMLE
jgi:hypothetical protein